MHEACTPDTSVLYSYDLAMINYRYSIGITAPGIVQPAPAASSPRLEASFYNHLLDVWHLTQPAKAAIRQVTVVEADVLQQVIALALESNHIDLKAGEILEA